MLLDPRAYAITIGRSVDLVASRPDAIPEQKGALRALVALSSLGKLSVIRSRAGLTANGAEIPLTLAHVERLAAAMDVLGIEEFDVAARALPVDLLTFVRALASAPDGVDVGALAAMKTIGVAFRRLPRTSAPATSPPAEAAVPPRRTSTVSQVAIEMTPELTAEIEKARTQKTRVTPPNPIAVATLRLAQAQEGDDLTQLVEDVVDSARHGVAGGAPEAVLEAGNALLNLEGESPSEAQHFFTAGLVRLLQPEVLGTLTELLREHRHYRGALALLGRAGKAGTRALLDRLGTARDDVDFELFSGALFALPGGARVLSDLIRDGELDDVRLAAELCARLALDDAVPALAAASRRPEAPVRQAAIAALARLGSRAAAAEVARVLGSGQRPDRLVAVRSIGHRATDALVGLLIEATAEVEKSDAELNAEIMEALGRTAHPTAVQFLIRRAVPGGRFFGRRSAALRVPAIRALGLSRSPASLGVLEELAQDTDRDVREAARDALKRAGSR